jgi:uncharacterized protein
MTILSIAPLLRLVTRWAAQQEEISACALVGSYARGQARPDSDVDLVVLTTAPLAYRRSMDWMSAIPLASLGLSVVSWTDEDYGPLWSRRMILSDGLEIEWGFTAPAWAATDPIDPGTQRVASDGLRILLDPDSILHDLIQALGSR